MLKSLKDYGKSIQGCFILINLILSCIFIWMQYNKNTSLLSFIIIFETLSILTSYIVKSKSGKFLALLTLITTCPLLLNNFIIMLVPIVKLQQALMFIIDCVLVIIAIGIFSNLEIRSKLRFIYDDIPELDELFSEGMKKTKELDEEDVILGKQVEVIGTDEKTYRVTEKQVILPAGDRFLHMLAIGPTGSGKTSQVLIPMIWRDIQIKKSKVGVTVLEPKGDLAEKVYAMVNYYNDRMCKSDTEKKQVIYFNPTLRDCPFFNPLMGAESDVIENMASTFTKLNADSSTYFKDMGEGLVRRAVKVLKRLYGDEATFLDFNKLIWNVNDEGRKQYISPLQHLQTDINGKPLPEDIKEENKELVDWFINDYFLGKTGQRGATKTYENTSAIRTQVTKIISNMYLKKVLNPPKNVDKIHKNVRCNISAEEKQEYENSKHILRLNFDEALEDGHIVAMSTAQGDLGELGNFLGYFIILQLQASVFRRPGNENTRVHNMLYIDEFQEYANPGFGRMLTQGRSYRVASHLATQARDQIANGRDGKNFLALVSANARNKIIYPGISYADAKYYSDEFGSHYVHREDKSYAHKKYFRTFTDERETVRSSDKYEVRFSPTDIRERPFGQITYSLIVNKSVAPPGVAQIEYIPREINEELDRMIMEDKEKREIKSGEEEYIIEDIQEKTEYRDPAATDKAIPEDIKNASGLSIFDKIEVSVNNEDIDDDF